jgi:hypothetical protein
MDVTRWQRTGGNSPCSVLSTRYSVRSTQYSVLGTRYSATPFYRAPCHQQSGLLWILRNALIVLEQKIIPPLPEIEVSMARPESRQSMPTARATAARTSWTVSHRGWLNAAVTDEIRIQRRITTRRTLREAVTAILVQAPVGKPVIQLFTAGAVSRRAQTGSPDRVQRRSHGWRRRR